MPTKMKAAPKKNASSDRAKHHKKTYADGRPQGKAQFFDAKLQYIGSDWLSPGTTKTGLVYRPKGNPGQSHE